MADSIQVKLEMKEESEKDKFTFIHSKIGSKFWSETLRHCIELTYQMYTSGDPVIDIDPAKIELISNLVKRPDIHSEYKISSLNNFVNLAVEKMLNTIQKEIQAKSIMHWEIISGLSEDEKTIANAIASLQSESSTETVSLKDIMIKTGKRNKDAVKRILDSFVSRGLLEFTTVNQQLIYHAP